MPIKGLNVCYLMLCLMLLLGTVDVESKRSFGLIRNRPKPNQSMSIRRRQQQPAPYTPQAQSHASSVAKPASAAKPIASAPAHPPAGPPPPYSPYPVKNIGQSHAAPPSYQSAMGANSPYPHANYPRQPYSGVNNGMYNNPHGMQPNYGGNPGMHSGVGGGGMYNNYGAGMNPGMNTGMNPGMMGMGMGMGMGGMGGMGMGGMGNGFMGGGGGYGYNQPQKSSSIAGSLMTGLAVYGAARGIGSMASGLFGGNRHGYGGGYGDNTQHVYLHHINQPAVVQVQGTPIAVQPFDGVTTNTGVQPLAPAITNPAQTTILNTPAVFVPAATSCTENCNENAGNTENTENTGNTANSENSGIAEPQVPTEIPIDFDAFPTIHPSLFTYGGGGEEILYWANTLNKNLTITTDSPTTDHSE